MSTAVSKVGLDDFFVAGHTVDDLEAFGATVGRNRPGDLGTRHHRERR